MAEKSKQLQIDLILRDKFSKTLQGVETRVGQMAKLSELHFTHLGRATAVLRNQLVRLATVFGGFLAIRTSLQTMIEFEAALVGVGKTTDIQGTALERLGSQMAKLGVQMKSVSTMELLEIAQVAGQLGIKGADNILKFTEVVGKLGATTVLRGEEAATTLARLLNVTGESVQSVDRLGAALVALGNNFAANEREIALMGQSIAQNTAVFGVAAADAIGLGTALAALGLEAEISGTSVGRTFRAIDEAVRSGGANLQLLAKITGETEESFARLFQRDSVAAFEKFVGALNGIMAAGGSLKPVLEQLEIYDVRNIRVVQSLANRYDELTRAVEMARNESERNVAMNKEFDRTTVTLKASLQALGNTWTQIVSEQRGAKDSLIAIVNTVQQAMAILFGMQNAAQEASVGARRLAAGLELVVKIAVAMIATKFVIFLNNVRRAMMELAVATKVATAALARNPVTLLGVAAAAVAGTFVVLGTDSILAALGLETVGEEAEKTTSSLNGVEEGASRAAKTIRELGIDSGGGNVPSNIADEWERAARAVSDSIGIMENQLALMRVEGAERDVLAFQQQHAIDLTRLEENEAAGLIGHVWKLANAIEGETQARAIAAQKRHEENLELERERAAKIAGLTTSTQMLNDLENERKLIGLTTAEREVAIKTLQFEKALRAQGATNIRKQTDAYRRELEGLQKLQSESQPKPESYGPQTFKEGWDQATGAMMTSGQRMADIGYNVATGLMNAFQVNFFDPMTGELRRIEEVLKDFARNVLNAFQQILAQQVALSFIKGIGALLGAGGGSTGGGGTKKSAFGNVFSHGQLMAFAGGGVFHRPTIFPMAGGMGLLGEAGPEAVMPLTRTPTGKLGVEARGGGSIYNINYSPTVNAQDARGVSQALREDRRAFKRMLHDVLRDSDVQSAGRLHFGGRRR